MPSRRLEKWIRSLAWMHVGFYLARRWHCTIICPLWRYKAGSLGETHQQTYDLEYGHATSSCKTDSAAERVVLIDDVLGQRYAAGRVPVEQTGAHVAGCRGFGTNRPAGRNVAIIHSKPTITA